MSEDSIRNTPAFLGTDAVAALLKGLRKSRACVYISFSSRDRSMAMIFAGRLRECRISSMYCDSDGDRSDALRQGVRDGLDRCDTLLCFVCDGYFDLPQLVADELDRAIETGKRIVLIQSSETDRIPETYNGISRFLAGTLDMALASIEPTSPLRPGTMGDAAPRMSAEAFG